MLAAPACAAMRDCTLHQRTASSSSDASASAGSSLSSAPAAGDGELAPGYLDIKWQRARRELAQNGQVALDRADVAADERSRERRVDAEALRVGECLAGERQHTRRAAVFSSSPASTRDLGDRVEQADEPARGHHRGRVVRGLAALGQRTGCAPIDSARSASTRQQRRVALERDRRALKAVDGAVQIRERDERVEAAHVRAGGHRRGEHGRGQARRTCGRAPVRCTGEGRRAAPAMASSGTVRKIRSASSRTPWASANAARAGHLSWNRRLRSSSRLATAVTCQPARANAAPSAVPTRPRR